MLAEKSSPYRAVRTGKSGRENQKAYLEKGVNLDRGLSNARKRPLSTFASTPQSTDGTCIVRNIKLGLLEEFLLEVLQEVVVEILTTKMGITSSCLDGKDTTSDVEERNIESSSTQVEDENVLLRT